MPLTSTRTPAMMLHASCTPSVSSDPIAPLGRRRRIAIVAGASVVHARDLDRSTVPPTVDRRPNGSSPRVTGLLFPIDPMPVCEVFNNFGGYSKTFGSGGHQGVDIGADLARRSTPSRTASCTASSRTSGVAGLGWGLWGDTDTKYRYYHLSVVRRRARGGRSGAARPADRLRGRHRQRDPGRLAPALRGATRARTARRSRSIRCRCSTSPPSATCTDPGVGRRGSGLAKLRGGHDDVAGERVELASGQPLGHGDRLGASSTRPDQRM